MEIALSLATAFIGSFVSIKLAKPIALRVELVDKPDGRKQHTGNIPLVGGIATFIGVMLSILMWFPASKDFNLYIIASAMMVFMGAIDDKHDLSVRVRIVAQILIASIMIFGAEAYIENLGNLFGFGDVRLSWSGTIFTLIAIVGAINAFNMVDGIDGLLGCMAINTLTAVAILFLLAGDNRMGLFPLIIVMAIFPYLIFNLGIPSGNFKKIFMGDAGSMFIGLSVVWLLTIGTQGDTATFRPITAVWLIAVPLMDMAAIMMRRLSKGVSPFKADRDHLHHIFIRAGYTQRQALSLISLMAALFSIFGVAGEIFNWPEWFMLFAFVGVFMFYCYAVKHIWKVLRFVRVNLTRQEKY